MHILRIHNLISEESEIFECRNFLCPSCVIVLCKSLLQGYHQPILVMVSEMLLKCDGPHIMVGLMVGT